MAVYLLDLDGTMYHGTNIIPEALEFLTKKKESGETCYFLTNNASRTPAENAEHMNNIGYRDIKPAEFYNSAMACVAYAKKYYPVKKVMAIGQNGLIEELRDAGFTLVEEGAELVMVGLNLQGNYELYSLALRNLLNKAKLLGTNEDRILLSESGTKLGNGSIIKMLEYASGQTAVITGKPHAYFLEAALAYWNLNKEDVIMVGDNLETDILCGINAGVQTVFVLGGVHNEKDIDRLDIRPDLIVHSLKELL